MNEWENSINRNCEVSVIMSEYNSEKHLLERAIKSIIEQTFKNFEFIIIDDCGINNVQKIVDNFNDPRIKVFKNSKNMGLIYSLNKAIELSNGKYIVRMDTDDYAYPNRIMLQYNFIKNNNEFSVVGMKCDYFDGNKIYGSSKKSGIINRNDLLKSVPLVHPTVIMNKEHIKNVGGYKNYNRCEDYALWIELFCNSYKLYVMEEKGIIYTIRNCDYSKRKLKNRKGFFKLLKSEYLKLNPPIHLWIFIYLKNIIAGIIPSFFIRQYHKIKFGGEQ